MNPMTKNPAANKTAVKKYKCLWECKNCNIKCFPTTSESRCICGHRLRNHNKSISKDIQRHSCSEKNCGCKAFKYIPAEGSWMLRCRCKRKAIEHSYIGMYVCCVNDDYNIHTLSHCYSYTAPYKSTKPPLQGVVCSGFNSPWVCNCGCSYNDHSQKFIELQVNQLLLEHPELYYDSSDLDGMMSSIINRGETVYNGSYGGTGSGVGGRELCIDISNNNTNDDNNNEIIFNIQQQQQQPLAPPPTTTLKPQPDRTKIQSSLSLLKKKKENLTRGNNNSNIHNR